jgi:hypothetical protein
LPAVSTLLSFIGDRRKVRQNVTSSVPPALWRASIDRIRRSFGQNYLPALWADIAAILKLNCEIGIAARLGWKEDMHNLPELTSGVGGRQTKPTLDNPSTAGTGEVH